MNRDSAINQLAHITGCSRSQVIKALADMSKMSEVIKKALKKGYINDIRGGISA